MCHNINKNATISYKGDEASNNIKNNLTSNNTIVKQKCIIKISKGITA